MMNKDLLKKFVIAGIDEVGRGSLAGPVVAVCAIIVRNEAFICRIDDSKKLSAKRREIIFHNILKSHAIIYGFGTASVSEINTLNILNATKLAMTRSYDKFINRLSYMANDIFIDNSCLDVMNYDSESITTIDKNYLTIVNCDSKPIAINSLDISRVLVDGNFVPDLSGVNTECVIGGDAKFKCIGAASIIAKVLRDRLMNIYHIMYPCYGWDKNKGYGTKQHIYNITKYGTCKLHRDLFVRKIIH